MFMKIGGPDKLYRKERRAHVSQADLAKEICVFKGFPIAFQAGESPLGMAGVDGWGSLEATNVDGGRAQFGRKGRVEG